MRLFSHRDRPFHLSALPLERLPRLDAADAADDGAGAMPRDRAAPSNDAVSHVIPEYFELFTRALDGPVAPAQAPVPDDPLTRADNLKASAYFLDAAIAGVCEIEERDWRCADPPDHRCAFVFLVEFGKEPRPGDPGEGWIRGAQVARTDLRAVELAAVLSGYVRRMGYPARGHVVGATQIDLARLAVRAGVVRADKGELIAPFLGRRFRIGALTTAYRLAPDRPLAPLTLADRYRAEGPASWLGVDGTRPAWERLLSARRPLHMGAYPMEKIKRADEPTTLVLREEIRRIPKRGDFFNRALVGDLGERTKRERHRFAMKHPYALGMQPLIQNMVPLQGTRAPLEPTGIGGDLSDPSRNADAIKALGYYLGADFVGICEAEPWMYYSHDEEGNPLPPYHKYAVVMLLDQGFETMEGASGDDWISASQSMRAYLRGAEIAGVMGAHCRRMGYSARSHSNADSELIHNPAILMAGLGEVSRIGDTILNPFIGPRLKSVLFTTDLPMTVDRPIDFGLQHYCEQCNKCARECPCDAIPFGPKVMFNGYEIWKADVEKCTRYRINNMKGSACGRCMKMCPWNTEDLAVNRLLGWLTVKVPALRGALSALDDKLMRGARNPIKRWWFDIEVVNGVPVTPIAGVNERDLIDPGSLKRTKGQRLAYFPPELQPPPGASMKEVYPLDRAAGLKLAEEPESPEAARARIEASTTDAGQARLDRSGA